MAAQENLTDSQIASEFALYGATVQIPIKSSKRKIILKKLNHLRARNKFQRNSPLTPSSENREVQRTQVEHARNVRNIFYDSGPLESETPQIHIRKHVLCNSRGTDLTEHRRTLCSASSKSTKIAHPTDVTDSTEDDHLPECENFPREDLSGSWIMNTPSRVQQYLSSLPATTLGIVSGILILFMVTLLVMFRHLMWFPVSTKDDDHLLICSTGGNKEDCYDRELVAQALKFLKTLFESLIARKGEVQCSRAKPGEDAISIKDLEGLLHKNSSPVENVALLLECCFKLVLANPHWKLRALKNNRSPATDIRDSDKIESTVAALSLPCRLYLFIYNFAALSFMFIAGFVLVMLLFWCIGYRMRQKEREQRAMYLMVDKIIDMLRNHYEQTREKNSNEPSFLAVQHVRDQLLPPAVRQEQQPTWEKAVAFIAASDSRIRLETRMLHGEEFEVWCWIQPLPLIDKPRPLQAQGKMVTIQSVNTDQYHRLLSDSLTATKPIRSSF